MIELLALSDLRNSLPPASLLSTLPTVLAAMMTAVACKHFLADFVLQTTWMARGKERVQGWAGPLMAHVSVHAAGMLLVALMFCPPLWWLALVDLAIHSVIDRSKAVVSRATRWPVSDERFWWLLGFDQLLHQLTNVAFVLALLAGTPA